MKLVVISSPDRVKNESETLELLFAHGLEYFHLRKPGQSKSTYIKFIDSISEKYINKIIVHNYHELIENYPLKGVHYTQYIKNFKYLDSHFAIHRSKSCHSIIEVKANQSDYDYVFLSPIFGSISKPKYTRDFDLKQLETFLKDRQKLPDVIALGGITVNKIATVRQIGFAGVAVLGTIWQEDSLEKRLAKFKALQAAISLPTKN